MTTCENEGTDDWVSTDIPDFQGRKVFVLNGAFYGSCVSLFAQAGFEKADDIEDADVVVFIGGSDVAPELYNQDVHERTSFDRRRDDYEEEVYKTCVAKGKIMFGICRGAQFLHVMNGGELWQHVENHAGNDHMIIDIDEDLRVQANSYHHQMLQANQDIEVVAICEEQVSKKFQSPDLFLDLNPEGKEFPHELEIEAGVYDDTKCFFVQGHPEVGNAAYKSWCLTRFNDYLTEWEFVETDEPND